MTPASLGGHDGDFARLAMFTRKAQVRDVRQGVGRVGGKAKQWLADLVDTDHNPIPGALVLGPRLPLIGSWGAVGFFGGNLHDPYFIGAPWTMEDQKDVETHVLLDRFGPMTFHLIEKGVYTIKKPAPHGGAQERLFQVTLGSVEMMGGTRRLARAGGAGEGGDERGDYVAVDAETSPSFVSWMVWVTQALQALVAAAGNPVPALPPPPDLGGDGAPAADRVPETDGQGGEEPATAQVVGRIVTGSPIVRGR